ncbi:MAG: YbaK/EbsC family protein [Anaerolineales bacterium]|nr:YbaK/EbsC family protein [Anaerolineales bacterium]
MKKNRRFSLILIGLAWPAVGLGFMALHFGYLPSGLSLIAEAFGLFIAGVLSGLLYLGVRSIFKTKLGVGLVDAGYVLFAPISIMTALIAPGLGEEIGSPLTFVLISPIMVILYSMAAMAAGLGMTSSLAIVAQILADRSKPPKETRTDVEGQLSETARKVQEALDVLGVSLDVIELPMSTRTAADAAAAVGCEVGQIAKSLIFQGEDSRQAYLVIASGKNHVDENLVAEKVGEMIWIAPAAFVRAETGYAIGGVPPVGHDVPIRTVIDQDLMEYDEIWAAAGTPRAVFRLTPRDLVALTKGEVFRTST